MGRVRLKMKKLENTNGRQATYAKRKNGIVKKANELAILCDIDIVLLMFSPTGKPCLCNGRSIEEVIAKFAELTPQERAKRKLESLESLRKTFKKLDHDVNIQDFLGSSPQSIEDLTNQSRLLQSRLSEVHRRLSRWTYPDKIDSVEDLRQMEDSLRESLNQIQAWKENYGKQQLFSLGCPSQFQSEMHLPFGIGIEQQFQHLPWLPNNNSQHMVLPYSSNLLSQRDMECPAGSSFGSYSDYLMMGKRAEIANPGPEIGLLSELNGTASLSLGPGGQYPYQSYNLSLPSDRSPAGEMSLQESPMDYHVDGNFEPPQPVYDTTHSWAPTSVPCTVAMYDEHLYRQVATCNLYRPLTT
ncbi:agamous-like MADS-box protein AGL30 isoform X2 [Malania oleifera]|uniref:agamous-like MADS-box protein AGL30 isoform X2 n=1 Tax=Malania oleifera TaxID=397392 RepID=UPI0025AE80C1|nr:agamous-like MADS-box protein AGL30 isoform X2 [Malania oleifera]